MWKVTYRVVTQCLLAGLLLVACATQIPPEIKEAPADNPTLEQVRDSTGDFLSRPVRWGGVIVETENRENTTWVTVLALPLSRDGKPEVSDSSPGRFIAIVPAFLDPMVYSRDRQVTFAGTVLRSETRKVGEFPYTYVTIAADHHYLWPVETLLPADYRYPWYYDPWYYDPWYYDPWYYPRYPFRYR